MQLGFALAALTLQWEGGATLWSGDQVAATFTITSSTSLRHPVAASCSGKQIHGRECVDSRGCQHYRHRRAMLPSGRNPTCIAAVAERPAYCTPAERPAARVRAPGGPAHPPKGPAHCAVHWQVRARVAHSAAAGSSGLTQPDSSMLEAMFTSWSAVQPHLAAAAAARAPPRITCAATVATSVNSCCCLELEPTKD